MVFAAGDVSFRCREQRKWRIVQEQTQVPEQRSWVAQMLDHVCADDRSSGTSVRERDRRLALEIPLDPVPDREALPHLRDVRTEIDSYQAELFGEGGELLRSATSDIDHVRTAVEASEVRGERIDVGLVDDA